MKTIFTIPILQRAVYWKTQTEVNFRSPSYGSSWACGIRPIIGIFLIWIDGCQNDITPVIFSWINGITPILIIVTFHQISLLSTLVLLSFCDNVLAFFSVDCQLWEDFSAASMNALKLPLLSHSSCSLNTASTRGGLSSCFVLEHVKLRYIFALLSSRIILTRFIFCLPNFVSLFFYSLFSFLIPAPHFLKHYAISKFY